MNKFNIGQTITAVYKTGKYIGEIVDVRPQHYLIKMLAVLKHPMQGDLHSPKNPNPSFFHERRALAFHEKTNVPKKLVHAYNEKIPNYTESLHHAVNNMKQELQEEGSAWADRSLSHLKTLEMDYFKK